MKVENKILSVLKWIFAVCFGATLLFFIIGEIVLPDESGPRAMLADTGTVNCQVFESEWERLMPNGSRYPVEVPGKYDAYSGEGVSLVTVLPDELEDQTWLCFQGAWQDMEFYVDGVLRERYSTKDTRPFGKNSAIAFVFVELSREDAGKNLKVITNSESHYSGTMNTVYMGDKFGIWITFLDWYGPSLLWEISMLIFAVIGILLCAFLGVCYRRTFDLVYLSSAIFFAGVWLISETEFRQLIFPNVSVVTALTFISLMLLPVTVVFYINGIQEKRYQKLHLIALVCGILNALISIFLQVTNQRDFLETLTGSHIVIVISAITVVVSIVTDCVKGYIKRYSLVAFGLLVAVVGAFAEVFSYYGEEYVTDGEVFCITLIFLLITASVKTIQDIIKGEKEKQRALVANEAKTKFLANMSHEIRTPINTILGMNEMILRENRDELVQEYAANIHNSGSMLLTLINDVLDFSRIEAGEVEIHEEVYQVDELLKEIVQGTKARADKKKLAIITDIDETLPCALQGDEFRIRQVIINLLSNAIKYTKEGSVTLAVKGEWSEKETFSLIVSVKDTGIGIKKEDIGKLFDSFTRFEEDKNRTIEGTGLGLSITKSLVELMHGDIMVESVYGEGSEFVVRLPQVVINKEVIGSLKAEYEKKARQVSLHKPTFVAPDARILVVDDNEMNLAVIKGLLKNTSMQLHMVMSGLECLALCRETNYDMILMDHMMPDPDGIETLHMLRAEEDNPNRDTKVIVLTANALAGSRETYLKEGFDDYLSKPVDATKLERVIRENLPAEKVVVLQDNDEETKVTDVQSVEPVSDADDTNAMINQSVGLTYCGGDMEMYCDILQTYVRQEEKYRVKMPQYYEEGDWKNYAILAHALKSTSLGIGAKQLSETAKRLELAAKNGETISAAENDELQQLYEAVLEEAKNIISIYSVENEPVLAQTLLSAEECFKAYEQLLLYIRSYEMSEAVECVDKIKNRTSDTKALERIKKYIEDYDYENAEEALLKLM